MTDQNLSLALNSSDCIKRSVHLTENAYHNVCAGTVTTVPNGIGDYFLIFLVVIATITMLGYIVATGVELWRELV